mmetsp:Transcript_15883/g.24460  ORF Transcript_15883/g.24460 Transcript_15883/m.24460 type:complete len:180 (-) Transcript_15883:1059-1598(-)
MSLFEVELQKKIRNKTKKLQQIAELEGKIKSKEIKANDAQLEKIATKVIVEGEIAEIKSYLDLHLKSKKEESQSQKENVKAAAKEVQAGKDAVVASIANVMSLISLFENDQPIPEELEGGVKHFTEVLNGFQARESGNYNWKEQKDNFVKEMQKLASGSKDQVADTTYAELAQGFEDII